MWNVARFEINTAIEMATTPWQKSVNQHISAVFAVLTMIIVAVIIALRETGKQRWIWYGTPIFVILIAFEYSSAIHYLNKVALIIPHHKRKPQSLNNLLMRLLPN